MKGIDQGVVIPVIMPIFTGVTELMSEEAFGKLKLDVARSERQAKVDRKIPFRLWNIHFD